MKKFEEYVHITIAPFKKYKRLIRIAGFLGFILFAILANMYWNKLDKSEKDFLKSLNLKLTLKVMAVKPTGNHGYGVIFGEIISSNKPKNYSAVFKEKYTFCKINDKWVLFVSDYYVMQKNDIIIINTSILKYWVYRKGKLISEYNLTNTTDDFLYSDINKNKYLDFNTYESVSQASH